MPATVRVCARIRPHASGKPTADGLSVLGPNELLVRNLEFSLDHVFDSKATQQAVYEAVGKDPTSRVPRGLNVCVIAYGQTGSGKTHTMFGPDEVLTNWRSAPVENHGIALRAMQDLFEATTGIANASVLCSYVEVYNDQCNDLLGQKKALPLREGPTKEPYIEGLTFERVDSLDSAMEVLSRGSKSRTVAQMRMNARSSRSHAVFALSLHSGGPNDGGSEAGGDGGGVGGGMTVAGKLVLVDLAGMESSKKSYSVEGASAHGMRREEARHINTSLYALGTVIERLSAAARSNAGRGGTQQGSETAAAAMAHVPFRDSKLTRLLQESLHGNSMAAFVVTLRAEDENLDECAATLRFAQRARAVPVRVRPNIQAAPTDPAKLKEELKAVTRELSQAKALIERLQREMGANRGRSRKQGGVPGQPGQAGQAGQAGAAAGAGAVGGRDDDDSAMEARRSELIAGRLAVGQLAEQMSDLIAQTRMAAGMGHLHAEPDPGVPPTPGGAGGGAERGAGLLGRMFGGVGGGEDRPTPAGNGRGGEGSALARAEAAEAEARAARLEAVQAVEEARRTAAAAKAEAADAVRAEKARAAKQVRSALATAAEEREAREADRKMQREAAAEEVAKRSLATGKANAAREKAEHAAAEAEARAREAELQATREKARADAAERARVQALEAEKQAERAKLQAEARAKEAREALDAAGVGVGIGVGGPTKDGRSMTPAAAAASQDPFPGVCTPPHAASAATPSLSSEDANSPNQLASNVRSSSAAQRRLHRSQERCTPRSDATSPATGSGGGDGGGGGGGVGGGGSGGGGGRGDGLGKGRSGDDLAQLHALAQFGRSQLHDLQEELRDLDPAHGEWTSQAGGMMYELTIPTGVQPGHSFQANVGGVLMVITCPPMCAAGDIVQVRGPGEGVGAPRQTRLPRMTGGGDSVGGGGGGGAASAGFGAAFGGGGGGGSGAVEVDEELLGFTPRTAEVLRASKQEAAALETLQGLFGGLATRDLRAVLERHAWDVNLAACELMDMGVQ